MLRDAGTLRYEVRDEEFEIGQDIEIEAEPTTEDTYEDEPDLTPEELTEAQERAWAADMILFGYRRTTIIQPSESRLRDEIAAVNAHAPRIRQARAEMIAELGEIELREVA